MNWKSDSNWSPPPCHLRRLLTRAPRAVRLPRPRGVVCVRTRPTSVVSVHGELRLAFKLLVLQELPSEFVHLLRATVVVVRVPLNLCERPFDALGLERVARRAHCFDGEERIFGSDDDADRNFALHHVESLAAVFASAMDFGK